jgi:Retrotransposon gag protein
LLTIANMATITTTSTGTAPTMATQQPPAPVTPPLVGPSGSRASSSLTSRMNMVMRRTFPTPAAGGPPGGGPPAGELPAGGPPAGGPLPVAQQPVAGGAQPTDKLMGALPAIFDGNRERADNFIEELKAYIRLNQRAMTSYIQRLALTLTLIKGPIVAAWTKDMGAFFDTLTLIDDVPDLWDQFLDEFTCQFQDSQKAERAHVKLQSLRMTWPNVDQYIADFEKLAREANYTIGNSETIQFFIAGLPRTVAEDVLKPPLVHHYSDIKDRAIQSLRSHQIIDQIFGN